MGVFLQGDTPIFRSKLCSFDQKQRKVWEHLVQIRFLPKRISSTRTAKSGLKAHR